MGLMEKGVYSMWGDDGLNNASVGGVVGVLTCVEAADKGFHFVA